MVVTELSHRPLRPFFQSPDTRLDTKDGLIRLPEVALPRGAHYKVLAVLEREAGHIAEDSPARRVIAGVVGGVRGRAVRATRGRIARARQGVVERARSGQPPQSPPQPDPASGEDRRERDDDFGARYSLLGDHLASAERQPRCRRTTVSPSGVAP